ncbi:MAG TPA: pyrimidine reductase family protein [Actinomycetes bacterium]|nr:pyrimidine reductase family protein [Actinomycetes bacterium]
MRCLLPKPFESVDIDQLASLYAYPADGGIRANMVTTLDGAVSANGKSEPISGPPDKYMFGVLRALADVVVVGAGTARSEGYGPGRERNEFAHLRVAAGQQTAPAIAVVTRSAELDPSSSLFVDAKVRTIVITSEQADSDRRTALSEVADVEICGEREVDLAEARRRLHARGLGRILTEGGPRLLGDFAAAGLLDELALSISPLIAGGNAGRIVHASTVILERMRLRTLLEADQFLFCLYERNNDRQTESQVEAVNS